MQVQAEKILARGGKVILKISRAMAIIAAVVLAFMMILTVIDVCGREFFLKPVEGTYELIGIMLVIAGCLGMGYCQLNQANIRITVISDLLPARGQAIIYLIAYIIAAATTGIIAWQGGLRAWKYFLRIIEGRLGGILVETQLPYWPFMLLLAIGFGWVCIIFIIDIVLTAKEVFRRGSD